MSVNGHVHWLLGQGPIYKQKFVLSDVDAFETDYVSCRSVTSLHVLNE